MFKVVVHDFEKYIYIICIFIVFILCNMMCTILFLSNHAISQQLSRELNASQLCHVTACQTSVQNFVVFS